MATKIRPINLHTTVDTHIRGLIDSSHVQARTSAGTDSASTQSMIDSNFTNMDIAIHYPDGAGTSENKITFGNDSDLKIYHNGNHSFIEEAGTGFLRVLSSEMEIRNANNNENLAVFKQNDAVRLYFNNSQKIETTDSGGKVTGNIAANIRSNPKSMSLRHTVDSNSNALLVGPINVDSGVTITINGTLMVV